MFCKSDYEYICKWLIYYCFKSLRPFIIRKGDVMKHFLEEELSAELKRNIFLPQITQMTRIFVFEHETRRRPTEQREVITRITRILSKNHGSTGSNIINLTRIPQINTDFIF